MRASRLLSLLMLLQTRGCLSARVLADELEVSERTIHRDIEHLSAAGVPVVSERGASGGFALLDGWRTRLTGLTPEEARAIFMAGAPGPAAQLGLGGAVASAQLKLLAALPPEWQADAGRVGARFHLDPVGWYRRVERLDCLPAVAQAVWDERRLHIRYESWKGMVERRIEPLGLVLKAGEWYVVATARGEPRTYKLSNIHALDTLDGKFTRPRRFDLAAHWAASIERFEAELYRATATVRVSASGLRKLRYLSAAVAETVDRSDVKPDRTGWTQLTIPIESVEHAAAELMRLGADCEVISPAELRRRLAETASAMTSLYRVDVSED